MDDFEEDTLLSPAFEVDRALIEQGVITSPRDGLHFLANVILERRTCLDVVTASLPNSVNNQNIFATEPPKMMSAPESLVPTLEWQNCQVTDFSDIRTRISKMYDKQESWVHAVKYPPIDAKNSNELWKNFLENTMPDASLVFTMKQFILEFILDFLIENLNEIPDGLGIDSMCGRWIFAVLAVIKLPLTPGACSSLRDLARKCSHIRGKLSMDDGNVSKKVAPLNLFICLTARYFRQGDLAD